MVLRWSREPVSFGISRFDSGSRRFPESSACRPSRSAAPSHSRATGFRSRGAFTKVLKTFNQIRVDATNS